MLSINLRDKAYDREDYNRLLTNCETKCGLLTLNCRTQSEEGTRRSSLWCSGDTKTLEHFMDSCFTLAETHQKLLGSNRLVSNVLVDFL